MKSVHRIVIHKNKISNVDIGIDAGSVILSEYSVNDLKITENTISWTTTEGISLSNGTNLLVSKNTIEYSGVAIRLEGVDETEIFGNNLCNFTVGLELQKGYSNNIISNTISDIANYCIRVGGSYNNISYNTVKGVNGISVDGDYNNIYNNTVKDGTDDGISVRGFLNDIDSNIIIDNWNHSISVWEPSNNITNNTIQSVNTGVWNVGYISSNEIRNCTTGVDVPFGTENVSVITNFFVDCVRGVRVGGNFSNIASNTFLSCLWGVHNLDRTGGNVIYHNMFLNSTAADDNEEFGNSWDNRTMGGNYWSDYECEDFDGDSFGDTPYIIYNVHGNEATNRDNYPLVVPRDPVPVFWKEKVNGKPYEMRSYMTVLGNLTVSRFHLDEKTKLISFNVTGHGYCNLTVPRELLDGAFQVFINDTLRPCSLDWNDTHTCIYVMYGTSTPVNVQVVAQIKLKGDLNDDGKINILDVALVAAHFGEELEDP